jgi:hypothetical protein
MIENKKVYYIGTNYGEHDSDGLVKWAIEGIFDNLQIAVEAMENDEWVVELNLNEKLPKEIIPCAKYYYKFEGKLFNQDGILQ